MNINYFIMENNIRQFFIKKSFIECKELLEELLKSIQGDTVSEKIYLNRFFWFYYFYTSILEKKNNNKKESIHICLKSFKYVIKNSSNLEYKLSLILLSSLYEEIHFDNKKILKIYSLLENISINNDDKIVVLYKQAKFLGNISKIKQLELDYYDKYQESIEEHLFLSKELFY